MQNLVSSPLLRPDQKIFSINQYAWPVLIFPLQSAPLNQLPMSFLNDVDKIVKSSVKEIIGLPQDTPNAMLYTSNNLRGLQIMRATWEGFIQHYNICLTLLKSNEKFIPYLKDLKGEMKQCLDSLGISEIQMEEMKKKAPREKPSRLIRNKLRNEEFDIWSSYTLRGLGVNMYKDFPKGNKIIINKMGLTSSEWISTIKMSSNLYPVRAIPGRSIDGHQCRLNTCSEKETLAHILCKCSKGNGLQNNRHHQVRKIIASYLEKSGWTVLQEVPCIGDGIGNKRVDIICFKPETKEGYILDPTVRFEVNYREADPDNPDPRLRERIDQANAVDIEKKKHYEPCIPYFLGKFDLTKLEVIGLLVGARGTIPKFFLNFCKIF